MLKHDFLIKDERYTSSYHFRSIIPKDLRYLFNGRHSFTISLRTGIYKDAKSISFNLHFITQSIFDQIRMGETDLDIEGIKKILKVEIKRSVKSSLHLKLILVQLTSRGMRIYSRMPLKRKISKKRLTKMINL